jgi:hypothetical protein
MLGRFAMELSTSESITMIYWRFTLKPNKRSLCSEVCMLGEITKKEQINKLTHEQHIAYSQLAPTPSPYRSRPEFHMFNNTYLSKYKTEAGNKVKKLTSLAKGTKRPETETVIKHK